MEDLRWETLATRRLKHKAVMMYKVLHGLAPSYLSDQFQFNPTSLSHGLRERGRNVLLAKPNTDYLKKSFKFSGARLWNELPQTTKLQSTLSSFKRRLPSFSS